jgi:hypothetical protein
MQSLIVTMQTELEERLRFGRHLIDKSIGFRCLSGKGGEDEKRKRRSCRLLPPEHNEGVCYIASVVQLK